MELTKYIQDSGIFNREVTSVRRCNKMMVIEFKKEKKRQFSNTIETITEIAILLAKKKKTNWEDEKKHILSIK